MEDRKGNGRKSSFPFLNFKENIVEKNTYMGYDRRGAVFLCGVIVGRL